jgi:outer membrane murein-binding lipoprotein Lpp
VGRWQCASCREDFRDWDRRDYAAEVERLAADGRTLAAIVDRLDGAGFSAAAKAVQSAQERVAELDEAIAEDLAR